MAPDRSPRVATSDGAAGQAPFSVIESTGPGPGLRRWIAIVAVLIGLAMAKPWGGPASDPTAPVGREAGSLQPASTIATAATSPAGTPASAGTSVASICFDPPSWRLATVERWHDRTIRVWRAMEPASSATGPDDQRVPVIEVVSEGVLELGWCAPVLGPVQVTGGASIEVWRRTAGTATTMAVTRQQPTLAPSALGALYSSPAARRTGLWNDGTYVFLHRAPDGHESWFAVDLERRPSVDAAG